ncbi:methionine/alanine import family NSS transporter small subunit [Aliibacillus thermotolerans]|uniref:Methionine/alanine import family NSS transporter small subunit n=1 Tax=Aliibacillus thermotolerans TaxID=1834418 RepID=A0ABW0U784_9BACI|nr:methionine/alanine import family NSS transporter small subunit [Aliibacillus thermotolerans]MDA3129674.1 methionine/alanine import family NSS transporter small subunit [Aliibacillus thermotolerans]
MTGSAIFMMILGILIIWGGLIASIVHARRVSKRS